MVEEKMNMTPVVEEEPTEREGLQSKDSPNKQVTPVTEDKS